MRSAGLSFGVVVVVAVSCGCGARGGATSDGGGATSDDGLPRFSLELLAGDIGGPGNGDGTGAAARFDQPSGVAVDDAGNVYAADYANHTIRKVTADGVVTTLAGSAGMFGSADGVGAAARFYHPVAVAVDRAGNVYAADYSHTIRKMTADRVVTTLAGTAGMAGSEDGTGAAARFYYPTSVAVDSTGNVYVTEAYSSTIRKVTAGGVVTTLTDSTGAAVHVSSALAAVDSTGNIYAAGPTAHSLGTVIQKVTTAG